MGTLLGDTPGGDRPLSRTAGIDWWRGIMDGHGPAREARDRAREIVEEDRARGEAVREWRFNGFEGERSARVRWGMRGGSCLTETSGAWAHDTSHRLALPGCRVTRLDLQATVRLSSTQPDFGMQCLGLVGTRRSRLPVSPRRRGLSMDSHGYWCGSVGARDQAEYIRVYDKGTESRTAPLGVLWRVEVEAKRTLGGELWETYLGQPDGTRWLYATCISRLRSAGCSWPLTESLQRVAHVDAPKRPPPTAGALALWLHRTCRPVVQRLLLVFTVREVLDYLGLTDVAVPRDERTHDGGSAGAH